MSNRERHADSWQQNMHRELARILAGVLDLIDCGTPEPTTKPYAPTRRQQDSTDRPDGNFHPTPPGRTRRSGRSDPTANATIRWELDVQAATTSVYALVSAAHDAVNAFALIPLTEQGEPLDRPQEPATRVTPAGRVLVNEDPVSCRRAILRAHEYIGAVADRIASRLLSTDSDAHDATVDRATWLIRLVSSCARRLDPEPVRLCAREGCRAPAPVKGQGATCGRCRTQRWREKQEAS